MIFFCSVSLCRDDYMQSSPQHGVMWKSAPSLSSIQISYISTDSHSDFPFIRSLLMNRVFSAARTCENERNENYIRWLYCPTRTAFKETLLQYHHDSVWELSAFINEIVLSITVQLLVPFTRSFPFEMFTLWSCRWNFMMRQKQNRRIVYFCQWSFPARMSLVFAHLKFGNDYSWLTKVMVSVRMNTTTNIVVQ